MMLDEQSTYVTDSEEDGLDVSAILAVPWRRRRLIGYGTLAATVAAVVYSLLVPRVYLSEGFYQLGNPKTTLTDALEGRTDGKTDDKKADDKRSELSGIPIPLFKTSSTQFSNPNRLQSFATHDPSLTEKDVEDIRNRFRTAADIERCIKPVYAYARDDAREFVQVTRDDNAAIGLNLSSEADSPRKAALYVGFLGRYVRDCLVYGTVFTYVMDQHAAIVSQLSRNENETINTQFELALNLKRAHEMQAILARHPESLKVDIRQLVSIEDGGYRYLSPVTQLVGIESAAADLRGNLDKLERTREQLMTREKYFSRCIEEMGKIGERGEDTLQMLNTMRSQVFTKPDLAKDSIKAVFNSLFMDMQRFDLAFHTNCRFISGPTVPIRPIRPSRTALVALAFFGSFAVLVLSAFVSSWWETNKQAVLAGNSR